MIGVFDSGLGGLTIYKSIEAALPEYDFMYLGDNARAPYGDHSQESILRYTTEALTYLFDKGCILVVLACSTASAEALREIQQKWLPVHYPDRNVLGVIRPLAEAAIEHRSQHVGVIATRSTVDSGSYTRELKKFNEKILVTEQACRLLVPLIEEGYEKSPALRMVLKKYLRPVKSANVDTVILGCTHYGIIHSDIERYMGKRVNILDSGEIVAKKFKEYLDRHPEYEQRLTKNKKRIFLTTEKTNMVKPLVMKFLGRIVNVEQVDLTI